MSDARMDPSNGYMLVSGAPENLRKSDGYAYEHRVVAQRALGRPLPDGCEIHHVDEDRGNNDPSNLVICEDRGYHKLLHRRLAAFRACGHADWLSCRFCKEYDDPENLYVYVGDRRPSQPIYAHHKTCARAWKIEWLKNREDAA